MLKLTFCKSKDNHPPPRKHISSAGTCWNRIIENTKLISVCELTDGDPDHEESYVLCSTDIGSCFRWTWSKGVVTSDFLLSGDFFGIATAFKYVRKKKYDHYL